MKPIKMWRVEGPRGGTRGVLAICQSTQAVLHSVYVADGSSHKDVDVIDQFIVDHEEKLVTIRGENSRSFRLLSEIPITEGTESVIVTIGKTSLNLNLESR